MKKTTKNHNKKDKINCLIIKELNSHEFRADGFSYLIALIVSIQKGMDFNPVGYEIAKKIQETIQFQISKKTYDAEELKRLTELLVAPLEQHVIFNFETNFNDIVHPQNFFCDKLWKNLLDSSKFDDDYIKKLSDILKAGLNLDVRVRYKRAYLKKDIIKNYIYCPYFITTFVLRWFVFTPDENIDFTNYYGLVKLLNNEKRICFILYYILLKIILNINKYKDDYGILRVFSEKYIYDVIQKYILDTKLDDIKKEETLLIPKIFFSKIDLIIDNVKKHAIEHEDFLNLIDVSNIESISHINSDNRWENIQKVVENIIARG